MHDHVVSPLRKDPVDGPGLSQIGEDKGCGRRHGRPMAGGEVIDNGDVKAETAEEPGNVAADEAGASRDQDALNRIDRLKFHHLTPACGDAPGVTLWRRSAPSQLPKILRDDARPWPR
jgi:hypothetical protein